MGFCDVHAIVHVEIAQKIPDPSPHLAIDTAACSSEMSRTHLFSPSLTDHDSRIRYGHLPAFEQEIKVRYTSVQAKSVAAAARAVIDEIPAGSFGYSAGFGLPYALLA
jgi:hypothetical protein